MLRSYLIITGALAALALAFPTLVQIGYLLILPGIALEMSPTAFLWGCIYAGMLRMAGKRWPDRRGVAASLAGTAAILVLVPCLMQLEAIVRLAFARAPDVQPTEKVTLAGEVRIVTSEDAYYGQQCDVLCVATLLAPKVRGVTVASTSDAKNARRPVRFSLAAYGYCGNREDQPHLPAPADWQWGKQQLDGRRCLLADPVDTVPDFVVRAVSRPASFTATLSPWNPLQMEEGVLSRGKTVLFRGSQVGVDALAIPLRIEGRGGFSHFGFAWATERIGVKRNDIVRVNRYAMIVNYTSVPFPQH